ncbi:ATP synthase subunit I [Lentisalinibacter sediminis]|uniref:ATP synthase subunit I n=1 Tax=Lentisalinibacter sediminis TaxID=2992237 RepID=UPI0038664C30
MSAPRGDRDGRDERDPRHLVLKILLAQTGLTLFLTAAVWIGYGTVPGYSLLIGGLICILPNAFLAARILKADLEGLMRGAWLGEIGKFALTVLLFGVVFALVRPLSYVAVLAGFILAQLVILIAPVLEGGATKTHSDG